MSTPSQPQHRIFISHSHIDNEFGTRLAQDLRRVLGDESAVWYDVLGGLHGGDNWWEKIVEELTDRKVFVVVLSPEAALSPWVRDEINLAGARRTQRKESASFRCCIVNARYAPISKPSRSSPFSVQLPTKLARANSKKICAA